MTRRRAQSGITLLEILVVLGIMGLLVAALAMSLIRSPKTALREDTARLAAVLRGAYDQAAATGVHHRVLIDLDQGAYRVERCEGKVRIHRGKEEPPDAGPPEAPDVSGTTTQAIGGAAGGQISRCVPLASELGKPHPVRGGRGVKITRVFVAHLEQPMTEGTATINFFPLGYAERSVVELSNGDDIFSVLVHPANGKVEIKDGPWHGAADYVDRDDEGKEITPP